jgi:prepilin signal peptidase PulO-like enzyme (type II secretory pathway)
MSDIFIIIALGLLGVCLGSFANAAIWRLKVNKGIVNDRSECVHCHHKLAAIDLIPVVSWLMLRGKCRYCGKKIDDSPLVELGVGAYFILSYLLWPVALDSTYAWFDFSLWLAYGVGLAILFVYDLKWYLLPDRVVWPLVALGTIDFIARCIQQNLTLGQFFAEAVLALTVITGLYGILHILSRGKWVGLGDVKLGAFMGLALGWQVAAVSVFLANMIGCLVVLPGLILGKLKRDSQVPFGPFLIAGFVITGILGQQLLDWYLNLFL